MPSSTIMTNAAKMGHPTLAEEKKPLWLNLLAAGTVAAVVSSAVSLYLDHRSFIRTRDQQALEQVVGPVAMRLARTWAVHRRYGEGNSRLLRDVLVMRDSNEEVRKILIGKAHLCRRNSSARPTAWSRTTTFGLASSPGNSRPGRPWLLRLQANLSATSISASLKRILPGCRNAAWASRRRTPVLRG